MAVMLRRISLLLRPSYRFFSTDPNFDFDYDLNSSEARDDKVPTENGVNNCPKSCLCSNDIIFDYKNVRLLSQFVSSQTGMMLPRTYTKICMTKQRELSKAIKRSRTMGFMPYSSKITEYLSDPKLF